MPARVSPPLGFDHLKGRRVSIYAENWLALILTSYASSVADVANQFVLRITGFALLFLKRFVKIRLISSIILQADGIFKGLPVQAQGLSICRQL